MFSLARGVQSGKRCSVWQEVFSKISGEKVRLDDFHRQNVVCVLGHAGEIAAVHLYSFFHLASLSAIEHSYFRMNYSKEALEHLRQRGMVRLMSMEYLTLDENYRRKRTGISIASVVIGLGYRVLLESGCDAMIAHCRRDLKVDKMAADFGAEPISGEFVHHGVPVVLMATSIARLKPHPDPDVRDAVDWLWSGKEDHSLRRIQPTNRSLRIA